MSMVTKFIVLSSRLVSCFSVLPLFCVTQFSSAPESNWHLGIDLDTLER